MVLKNGQIEEIGSHDELLARRGEFYRLVEMQREMSEDPRGERVRVQR